MCPPLKVRPPVSICAFYATVNRSSYFGLVFIHPTFSFYVSTILLMDD